MTTDFKYLPYDLDVFRAALKEGMKRHMESTRSLGKKTGISNSTISQLRSGAKRPLPEHIVAIAAVFDAEEERITEGLKESYWLRKLALTSVGLDR